MLVKSECVRGRVFATRSETNLALFEYIDGFYNSRCLQERRCWLSPIEFEERHYTKQTTAGTANLNIRLPVPAGCSAP
ncbi:IS3 family transposase [Streptomyces sp. NPDC088560]|uniref:IS3 family transposase n=1 Tax=Streptomyces sp. NPDC088560 TaxID=3365868 RepID=UPI0037FB29C4